MSDIDALLALTIKHFICDFPLQSFPWMYRNKGAYGHPGGIAHAAIHGIATAVILGPMAGLVDFLAHYHIDWAKMRTNAHFGLRPDNSEWFWILLGLDQLLHSLTYFYIVKVMLPR